MLKQVLFFAFFFAGFCFAQSQDIIIQYNEVTIANNGSNKPKLSDGTLYEDTALNRSRTHIFSIYNERDKDVSVDKITINSNDFSIVGKLGKIKKKSFINFELQFEPLTLGAKTAVVIIELKQGRERTEYRFNIAGQGISDSGVSDIMISQYYENADEDYIEIKNMSGYDIKDKQFYLVLFKRKDDLSKEPKGGNIIEIKKMISEEVRVYDKFKLEGNDIIIISTSKGENSFKDRVDIIGQKRGTWGKDVSLSKGACASEIPHTDFKIDDWISLSLAEVDNASQLQNIDLGTYNLGSINWNGIEWTDGYLPDRTRTVIIDQNKKYTNISGRIEACDLIVNGELNFRSAGSNNSVIVYRDLTVSDITGSFKLGDKMSLVMYDDDANITGKIIKYEKSTKINNQFDFTYWSSPVKAANVANVFSGVRSGRTYYFDQSKSTVSDPGNDPEGTYWNVWVPANNKMKPGKGYASEASKNSENRHTVEFIGEPNNGTIREKVHYNNDADKENDWNLIGNPYPSAINIDLFLEKNKQFIDPTIYLWTHATQIDETGYYSSNDYVIYNKMGGAGAGDSPKENIGSGQGFMVRVDPVLVEDNSEYEVEFNNSMRIIDRNDQFFKSSIVKKKNKEDEEDKIWINLTTDQGGFSQLLIGFVEGATFKFDRGYDALRNPRVNKISFYSLLNDQKLTIQGLGLFDASAEVLFGFDTKVANRIYTIEVAEVQGQLRDAEIILQDHYLNLSHNLRNSNYNFEESKEGSYQDRFSLIFTKQVEVSEEIIPEDNKFLVFNEGDIFSIEAADKVETVRMYDIYGHMILENHPRDTYFDLVEPLSKRGDVLLIQIINSDQSSQVKKIFKR